MHFANLGAKLILSARNKDALARVKKNILSKFARYLWRC
jgi:dehydrogenase/reductase SDR family member 7